MSIKGHSLLRSGILRWWSKVLFYFDNLELLMSIKSPPLLQSGIVMSIKGPLLLWSGIVEMSIKFLLLLWFGIAGIMIKGPPLLRSGMLR